MYSRGQPSQTKVSRKILVYTFLGLAFVNVGTLVGLLVSAIVNREYSSYQRNISYFIVIVSLLLTIYGSYAMQKQSLNHLTIYTSVNLGVSVILFPLSPTPIYFVHFFFELLLIYIAYQLKYRLDDLWFIPSSTEISGQIVF